MKIDWTPLEAELRLWRSTGLALPVWWRDDDAVAATPALERLTALAQGAGMRVHVAVIPALMQPSLTAALEDAVPLVHGWRHISHAPAGAKNAEFGQPRAAAQAELEAALARMRTQFGAQLLPMFVPPWNRIADDLLPLLEPLGYGAVSCFGARAAGRPVRINTHIDPIFWRGHRGLVDTDLLVDGICDTLRARREGRADPTEPLGLLTHHLVHTEEVWTFSADIMRVLLDGGAHPADLRALVASAVPRLP